MVFSSSDSQSESITVSQYGVINTSIQATPLLQGTTVKDFIVFNCSVQIYNCTRTTLSSLLSSLENEILTKVDTLLSPLQGEVNDGQSSNIETSTVGLGTMFLKVQPVPLISGTSNPDEIVFQVELQLNSCNRPKLVSILNGLDTEIMDKVNDVL